MLVWIYLLLVVFGGIGTWFAITPPERRTDAVQPIAALTASILFAFVAIASLNIQVPDGAGGEIVYDSLYLVILWAGFSLLNIIGLVTGIFEQAFEESEARSSLDPYGRS
jgi:hypothetical protein